MAMIALIVLAVLGVWCAAGLVVALAFGRAFAEGSQTLDLQPVDLTFAAQRRGADLQQGINVRSAS